MYNTKVSFRTILKHRKNISTSISKQKKYEDIPGPKSYPVIGGFINYVPFIGKYRFETPYVNALKKYKKYGPIVREEIDPGVHYLLLFRPEDIESLYRVEGQYPERRSHLALEHFRLKREHVYNNGGLLPTNGKAWWKIRKVFQKGLSSPTDVRSFLTITDEVVSEWIEYIEQDKSTEDYLKPISRLFLEIFGRALMDTKFNAFSKDEFWSRSRTSKLIEATETINGCVMSLDARVKFWKIFETPVYKRFKKAHMLIEEEVIDILSLKMSLFKEPSQPKTLLESYLSSPHVDFKDITGTLCDLFLGGIDTTSYTSCFILYHLAKWPNAQDNLHKEALELLPQPNSPVTAAILERASYTKAVVKESLRLRPVAIGIGRILTKDTVFSGYEVPKGTAVATQSEVSSRFEKHFPNPNDFIPERWIKSHPLYVRPNPFLVMPFGQGPRMCIARRFAEQNMNVILLKLIRNYEIRWKGGVLNSIPNLVNKPDGPISLQFIKRAL